MHALDKLLGKFFKDVGKKDDGFIFIIDFVVFLAVIVWTPEESDRGHTITAKSRLNRRIYTKEHRNTSKVSLLHLFYRKKVKMKWY